MVSFVVQCVGQRTGLVPRGICGTILKANLRPNLSSEGGQFSHKTLLLSCLFSVDLHDPSSALSSSEKLFLERCSARSIGRTGVRYAVREQNKTADMPH